MIGLWIKNFLSTYDKRKLRDFKSEYIFNTQYDGYAMFFVIVKMVRPDTQSWCLYINYNLENMKMSHFKHDIPKYNLQIAEFMNEIYVSGETYSESVRQKLTLYSTS